MAAKKRVCRERSSRRKTPNWLQMPDEIMGGMIFKRLDVDDILLSVQRVCRSWRRICKDPAMWKVIDMHDYFDDDYDNVKLTKQAVRRSCGELINITLHGFGTDRLLEFISRRSSKLKSLCLTKCNSITGDGLVCALKRLPCLETLDLPNISIDAENIKVIGQSCPQLKSFKINAPMMMGDGDAFAIANSMPALRHLQLLDSMITGNGLQAILHGCPHLESLDISGCFILELDGNLEKLCRERIKTFKFWSRSSSFFKGCMCGPGGCMSRRNRNLSFLQRGN